VADTLVNSGITACMAILVRSYSRATIRVGLPDQFKFGTEFNMRSRGIPPARPKRANLPLNSHRCGRRLFASNPGEARRDLDGDERMFIHPEVRVSDQSKDSQTDRPHDSAVGALPSGIR
jgi:hypothetical protein